MDLPYQVLDNLAKKYTLDEELATLIYYLLQREVEQDYPSAPRYYYKSLGYYEKLHQRERDKLPQTYTKAFDQVLSLLPRLYQKGNADFIGRIGALVDGHVGFLFDGNFQWQRSGMWRDFFSYEVAFNIEDRIRFEGTHVLAKQGSGKTTLLAQLIYRDMMTDSTVIVMTPKGDLIPTLESLAGVDAERLIIIRPEIKTPLALNVFDLGGRTRSSTVDLINNIFSAGLDASTTWKQKPVLDHCIRLLLTVEGATIDTLYKLITAPKIPDNLLPYLSEVSDVTREFFETQFTKSIYKETKDQIITRLDALRNIDGIVSMFSAPKTLFKMGEEIERGKIILIDTSEATLGTFGSRFFGRFFLNLVRMAFPQRDITKNIRPVWFYLDEAGEYLDHEAESFFSRARESRVGTTVAHQYLSQLREVSPNLESAVKSATVKYMGTLTTPDARDMASAMRVEKEVLEHQDRYSFLLKGVGKLTIPIKSSKQFIDSLPKRTPWEIEKIRDVNRAKYCVTPETFRSHTGNVPESYPKPADDDFESLNQGRT